MACTSCCCGAPKDVPVPTMTAREPTAADCDNASKDPDYGADACCSSEAISSTTDASCPTNTASLSATEGDCCSSPSVEARDGGCCTGSAQQGVEGDCCGPPAVNTAADTYCSSPSVGIRDDGCCAGAAQQAGQSDPCSPPAIKTATDIFCVGEKANDTVVKTCDLDRFSAMDGPKSKLMAKLVEEAPPCCEGKSSPCCDTACLDRIALRECETEGTNSTRNSSSCGKVKAGRPCSMHARRAREKFSARLEALGCICRALLALGQESCCPPRGARSGVKYDEGKKRSAFLRTKSSCSNTCCDVRRSSPRCSDTSIKKKQQTHVSRSPVADIISTSPAKHKVSDHTQATADVEKGLSEKERVVLSISGMTCTGCETKLSRTLSTVPAISNLKTSLILARAEFQLDVSLTSVEDVIKHLGRTTEFKCERISNRGSTIDVVCHEGSSTMVDRKWPEGVVDVKALNSRTVRITFDANTIGARDLVRNGWSQPLALAALSGDPSLDTGRNHVRHLAYVTLLSILLTIPVLVLAWAPLPNKERMEITFGSISLALATIIQVFIAGPFYPKALKALVYSHVIEMDLLVVLSTSAAYIFSVVAFGHLAADLPLSTGEFFETSTLLVTLIMVGRYIAALARQKAVESISVRSLQSSNAVIQDESGEEQEIDARLLQYGDVFKVFPESKVPTDGTVISGSSEIDESMITGESLPVSKSRGSTVIAGTINGPGVLTVRLTRIPNDNTVSTIADMVDEAKLSKPRIQDVADQIASYFVPVVVAITVLVFCIWVAVGLTIQNRSGSDAVIQAITYAITVLIVSCPCAIGLAVPMVVVIASGVAAEHGVIYKSANAIEITHKTSHVIFDKTGTLTEGSLSVVREEYLNDVDETRSLLLGLIKDSKHPVSVAVFEALTSQGVKAMSISETQSAVAKGMLGVYGGRTLKAGNSCWLNVSSHDIVSSIHSQGYTSLCFTIDGHLAAVFGLSDTLRPSARPTIFALQSSGITVHILSGDDSAAVQSVATQLSVPTSNIRSRCTPADKQAYIESLLATTPQPVVMFVGDGTNDAPALAACTVGVHMSTGTDVASSAADVVLLRPDLVGILIIIRISRVAIHRIAFNFGWSAVYNVVAILLAAGAFVKVRIPPAYAGLGELVSVLPVVAAGVALKWARVA